VPPDWDATDKSVHVQAGRQQSRGNEERQKLMNWKIPLIITHMVPYILIPGVMVIFHKRKDYLKDKIFSYPLIQAGFVSLILSMLVEAAWHHFVQNWEYQNDTHLLNGLMYLFMNAGFAFLALGFRRNHIRDLIAAAMVVLTPVFYFLGIKQPIWLIQTYLFIDLVLRAHSVLRDKRIIWFPVFSLGVNMGFIMLLFIYDHPVFHILHDLLGTLLGFAIFGWLVWINPRKKE
jgi:hypothetical protein